MIKSKRLPKEHQPKLIIAGGSAYPRQIDFARFRAIADEIGAFFMVDMAHFAGLVAGKAHPNPLDHCHVATTTTHKTLRGPRGGMVLTNDADISKKVNSAVFPGIQGGPLMHVIAGKAVAFGEALTPEFEQYAADVVAECQGHGRGARKRQAWILVSGGTDTHVALIDLRPKGVTGRDAEQAWSALTSPATRMASHSIPKSRWSPAAFGSARQPGPPAASGWKSSRQIGRWIGEVVDAVASGDSSATEAKVRV